MNLTAKRSSKPIAARLQLAPEPPGPDPYAQAARQRRLKVVVVSGTVLALVALLAIWNVRSAAAHYTRGRQALVAQRYSTAIQEFNAARIILFSYRDAEALAVEAADAIDMGMRREAVRQTRLEDAVRGYVKLADTNLVKGDAAAAVRALADARERVPEGQLSGDSFTLALLYSLSRQLNSMCRRALAEGRWSVADTCAAGLLTIDPEDAAALRFTETARRGADLQERLDDARAAARRGEWRKALRLASTVLDRWPGFPGAARLVKTARAALAPKPSPTPTSGGGSVTPEPPPPPPAPEPTAPPPP